MIGIRGTTHIPTTSN